ncbi:YesL family protein [Bacillus sp. JCM 19034]|uniref:YesL family protein n=1 Tax=Bacillus sp. JCM 19034 TaxID=1481928 RepID=UPI00078575CE|nr:DUF624 domain-containing protein [Bacillus sp. JCM 19034]
MNLIWIGFSAIGLFVVGFFPATIAMFAVVRKWVRGEQHNAVFRTFWSIYKQVFLKANLFGWVIALIGGVLYLNYRVIVAAGTDIPIIVVLSYIIMVLLYFLFIVTLLPVSVHFTGGTKEIVIKCIQFMIGRAHLCVVLLLLVWTSIYLSLSFPTVLIFFTGSVLSYMMMWFFHRSLEKLEMKATKEQYS